jgi:hypothetical protein
MTVVVLHAYTIDSPYSQYTHIRSHAIFLRHFSFRCGSQGVEELRTQALASDQASALAALAGIDRLQELPPHFTASWLGMLLQKEKVNGKKDYAVGKVRPCRLSVTPPPHQPNDSFHCSR